MDGSQCPRGADLFTLQYFVGSRELTDSTFEKHYSITDLKTQWAMGRETVRKLVMNEPGVVRIKLGRKKANTTYSVPESVARRIHTRLLNAA